MTRSNPFFRRVSSPADHENPSPTRPSKLTQESLSESALKIPPFRPDSLRNTQPRTTTIRPSRFVKVAIPTASFSSPITSTDDTDRTCLSPEMADFVDLFDLFTQKVYMEGYLMKHDTQKKKKMFAELSGSTLTLWDTELTGATILPTYLQMTESIVVHSIEDTSPKKKRHVFSIQGHRVAVTFETSDEPTMVRWVCAIRLCSFEKQRLHHIFTHRLLLPHAWIDADVIKQGVFLQVRMADSIWQKYWVVLNHTSKRFGRKPSSTQHNLWLFEHKRSKTPVCSIASIQQAYAVYPESAPLIEKGSMIRIVGTVDKTQKQVECWLMAGDNQTTVQWIMALYDQFGLYGRPGCLLKDPHHTNALNFGDNNHALFLETNDVVQHMKASPMPSDQIETMLIEMMVEQQSSRLVSTKAQSLPAITIDTPEEVVEQETKVPYQFSRQVADSSDESSGEDDEEEEKEEDEEEKKKDTSIHSPIEETPTVSTTSKKSPVNELIPDFDFGNGFDVPKSVMAAVSANISQTLPTRGSRQRRSRYRSSMALFSEPFEGPHQRKSSMPIQSVTSRDGFSDFFQTSSVSSVSSSSCTPPARLTTSEPSLFGDFNLGGEGDFNKFLQEPLDYHRKFSLTFSSAELTSPSVTSSHDWETESSELPGPMIPSLGDHFAPQNSLLDTYLGDQLSAKEQIEYAKATGQPLIKVSKKETGTKGGLVGVISQREKDRKEGTGYRVAERVNQHHAQQDRFEKEKERRLLEQRQQQFMKHQMLLYANGYNAMAMMHPQNYATPMMSPPAASNMVMLPQYTSSSSLPVHPYNLSPTCMPPTRNIHRPFYGPSPPNCPPTGYYGGSFVPNFNLPSTMFSQGRKASQSTSD